MAKGKLNLSLIKQALHTKQANTRQATSHVKTRGEVSGGGKKPWKQKGTGRARAGSSRSPIWSGGGIVFGPSRERHYKLNLPKKMNRAAINQLLKYRLENNTLQIIDTISLKEPRTKLALAFLAEHNAINKSTTIVTKQLQPELLAGTNNLKHVSVVLADSMSILDIAHVRVLLMDKSSAEHFGLVEKPAEVTKPKKTTTTKKK